MKKLLYIQASPRKGRSKSIVAADAFLNEYKLKNPKDQIITLNLFEKNLPTFDGFTINAKYAVMHGKPHTNEEAQAWKVVTGIIDEFKSADKYLFAIPMWNFGIPYRFKQYLDIIVQPTYTFGFDSQGNYIGLVTGKPAMVIFSRGGDYSDPNIEKQVDHQKSYIETILGFIGFKDIKSLIIQPTLAAGEEVAKQKLDETIKQAKLAAGNF